MSERRPLIAMPARFSTSASALRYQAEVMARALVQAVYAAGGEPIIIHPFAPDARVDVDAVAQRLAFVDGVLLPGGGDLSPRWTGDELHPEHYDVDEEQDAFDLAVARWALRSATPTLAICRGLQAVNVALGGRLNAHMDAGTTGGSDHRNRVHEVSIQQATLLADVVGPEPLAISCYHHQSLADLAPGLSVWGRADDGTIEAVGLDEGDSWFLGVQWHPEDTSAADPRQAAIFDALVMAARRA